MNVIEASGRLSAERRYQRYNPDMHIFVHFHHFYTAAPSAFDLLTLVLMLGAVGIAIYQSILSRKSLDAAAKTIENDTKARQLAVLPKFTWVIEVQVILDRWIEDLERIKSQTVEAVRNRDINLLAKVTVHLPAAPDKVGVRSHLHRNLPEALREILMSGAQYYYDATAPAKHLWNHENGANWSLAESIHDRYDDSLRALKKLKGLISDMVPEVILNTPASIREGDFVGR